MPIIAKYEVSPFQLPPLKICAKKFRECRNKSKTHTWNEIKRNQSHSNYSLNFYLIDKGQDWNFFNFYTYSTTKNKIEYLKEYISALKYMHKDLYM